MFRKLPLLLLATLGLGLAWGESPRLEVDSRWVGNTLPGAKALVPMNIVALARSADGRIFSNVPWEEAGWNTTAFKDGTVLGSAGYTHGWGNSGGRAVAANGRYLFIAGRMGNEGGGLKDPATWPPKGFFWNGISRRPIEAIKTAAPFPDGKGGSGSTLKSSFLVVDEMPEKNPGGTAGTITGLWATEDRLFASCSYDNTIKVFNAQTMERVAVWEIERPGGLAMDGAGDLWMLENPVKDLRQRILCLDASTGKVIGAGIDLGDGVKATGLSVNRAGTLVVADAGKAQQILVFQASKGTGRATGAIGEPGGIYSKPHGKTGLHRFNMPSAVLIDDEKNVTVAQNGSTATGGTVLEQYDAAGRLKWQLHGLTFVDIGEIDPGDESVIFTKEERFAIDLRKAPQQGWSYEGYTVDPFRFPEDPRLHIGSTGAWVRRLGGARFLFVNDMNGEFLQVYRFESGSETAIPSGLLAKKHREKPDQWPPNQPPKGEWLWRDTNGNAAFDAGEYASRNGENAPPASGRWVDSAGDIWLASYSQGVRKLAFGGLDGKGNPRWDFAKTETFPHPAEFKSINRIRYRPESDVMILGGITAEHKNQHWKAMGPVVAAYSGWARGERKLLWKTVVPYAIGAQGHSSCEPIGFDVAGDFVFLPYTGASQKMGVKTGRVEVLKLGDGSPAGHFEPGAEIGEIGLQDVLESLSARKMKDGSYVILVEDDYKAKILMYHWSPVR